MEERLQLSKYVRVVPRMDGFALYHSLYGGFCVVDKNIKDVLKLLAAPQTGGEVLQAAGVYEERQIDSLIRVFKSKGFLIKPGIDEYAALRSRIEDIERHLHLGCQINIVQLVVTNLCNFRCKYCFIHDLYSSKERLEAQVSNNNRMMTVEAARVYIEKTIALVKKNGKKSLLIQFFGGEPLINWKVIKFILEHFENGSRCGIEIGYSLVTNGSLFTDEIAEYCKNYNVPVVVSFDSPKGKGRIYANGKNSNDEVKSRLSLLKEYGIRVVLNSVLSEETFPYYDTDLIDFALQYLIFEIGVLLDLDPKFYEKRETKDIVDKLWNLYIYGKQRGILVTGYWQMIFQQLMKPDRYKVWGYKTCSATGWQLSVEPSGAVFACKGSSGYFGNILRSEELLSSSNYRKYAMRTFRNAPDCAGCEIESFCSGFCLGPLEKKYGDIGVIEKNTCALYKELTRRLIRDVDIDDVETYKMPAGTTRS